MIEKETAYPQAVYHCTSCDKYFADGYEFPVEYYTCHECDTYWDKSEGRNCDQCHKFGSNTDEPVCSDCESETESFSPPKLVDPEMEDVMGADGNEIVTPAKKQARSAKMRKQEQQEKERVERREKWTKTFVEAVKAFRILEKETGLAPFGRDVVVAYKRFQAVDSVIHFYATVDLSSYLLFDGTGLPYEIEFRIKSGGYGRNGGFDYQLGENKTFTDIAEAVAYAKKRIAEDVRFCS